MKVMVIDGNSIINRAFYGVKDLRAPDGTPTNALFGFLNILSRLRDEIGPDVIKVAFDVREPTFRHKSYEGYKATRKGMPDELAVQIPLMKEILEYMGIEHLECPGYEADDILGCISAECDRRNIPCVLVTGDKDSLQLITENTSVCLIKTRMGATETVVYTPEVFRGEYGFEPVRLIDLKALMGDSSDNYPGVPGIGEKTAMQLIQEYHTLDELYAKLPDAALRDSVKKKLETGEESARMSYDLATIVKEVPLRIELEPAGEEAAFGSGLYELFRRLGFQKLIAKYGLEPETGKAENETAAAGEEVLPDMLSSADERWSALQERLCEGEECVLLCTDPENREYTFRDGQNAYRFRTEGEDATIAEFLFSPAVKKAAHNVKELIVKLRKAGIECGNFVFDTALAAWLLDAVQNNYELPYITPQYTGADFRGINEYALLVEKLRERIRELGMEDLLGGIELPLCDVLADMEQTGFRIDREALARFGEGLTEGIRETQERIWSTAGYEFNINSPKQLGQFLFDERMLPYGKKTKSGWSTNAEILEKLKSKDPVVEDILEYRTLSKLKSTYADGLSSFIDENERIHTSFQMTATATGRLSSTEPNLQNIPIRKQVGAQIRDMFTAGPGNVLVDADYSQIELRILAHLADDAAMIEAFRSGMDFHAVTAASVFRVPVEEVTPALRSQAKAVNFGIVYGISAFALSQDIGVSVAEAKSFMEAYYDTFSGIADYMEKTIEDAKKNGYVTTMFGRRRNMPELHNSNFNIRSFGERVARNMPVQGTAADIIKIAMIRVYDRFREEGLQAKLVLQVHDELIVECPESEAETVKQILMTEMSSAAELRVPLSVEVGIGRTWSEAH